MRRLTCRWYNGSSPQKRIHESAGGNNRSDPKQLGCIVGIWNMWLTQGPQMLRELAGHPFGITKRPARKCGNSDVVGQALFLYGTGQEWHRLIYEHAQSLPKGQFNGALIASNAARPFDQWHHPVHKRRDGFNFTRHPGLDLEQGMTRTSPGKPQPQIRTSVRGLSLSHRRHLTLSRVPATTHSARNQTVQIFCCSAGRGTTCSTYQ